MQTTEYERLDGLALAKLLERGEVTSAELMDCAIELAEQRNPVLNALTYPRYEESRGIAAGWTPRGPFRGIPFLLKDSGFAHKRFPSSIGSALFNGTTYPYAATVADRFEAAGLIPFARTTVPELCMAGTTEAVRNGGATPNPWDRTRSAGGSSGGAAAAVAARIVPVAHGSDGGGSIRIPAACCGVFGLKPSRGRVPMGPAKGEGWAGMATDGVLSISVRDTAAALDMISGYEAGAFYARTAHAARIPGGRSRIGFRGRCAWASCAPRGTASPSPPSAMPPSRTRPRCWKPWAMTFSRPRCPASTTTASCTPTAASWPATSWLPSKAV